MILLYKFSKFTCSLEYIFFMSCQWNHISGKDMDAILSFNARLQRGKMILDNLLAEEKLSRMPLIILQSSGGGGKVTCV